MNLETKRNAIMNSVASSNVVSWEALADGTITEAVSDTLDTLYGATFKARTNLVKLLAPNCTTFYRTSNSDGLCQGCTSLRYLNLTSMTSFWATTDLFNGCTSLKVAYFPITTANGNNLFNNCTSLEKLIVPKIQLTNSGNITNCTSLKLIDMLSSRIPHAIPSANFETLIIRGNSVCSLSNTSYIPNDTCEFYVPSSLVASYKTATNWSALPNIESRVHAIEGSDYEDTDWYESTQEYRTEVLGE